MNKREISGEFGVYKIINEEWECSACKEWSNSVEWFHTVSCTSTIHTCPKCNSNLEETE